jgi:hypothetical protein
VDHTGDGEGGMKTHRIDLSPAPEDKAKMSYSGQDLGLSRQPLFAAARKLLAEGLAKPEDRIETWRGETKCPSGPIWVAAKLSVRADGPSFTRWRPFAAWT